LLLRCCCCCCCYWLLFYILTPNSIRSTYRSDLTPLTLHHDRASPSAVSPHGLAAEPRPASGPVDSSAASRPSATSISAAVDRLHSHPAS
jgi:hypothetical protein